MLDYFRLILQRLSRASTRCGVVAVHVSAAVGTTLVACLNAWLAAAAAVQTLDGANITVLECERSAAVGAHKLMTNTYSD